LEKVFTYINPKNRTENYQWLVDGSANLADWMKFAEALISKYGNNILTASRLWSLSL